MAAFYRPLALTLGLLLGAAQAEAGLLTLTPGTGGLTFGDIPSAGSNQALPIFFGIPASGDGFGWYGAVVTGSPLAASYTFDVFGAEAGFRNQFSVDGTALYTHAGGNNLGLASKATYTGTTLDFSFLTNTTNSGNPPSTLVTNDLSATGNTNNTTSNRPNFFATFNALANTAGSNPLTGDVLWLFLDDSNQVDDNHDDLVVRITATPVPLPPAVGLFVAGLGAVAALRRRR
jgi:hypothetical protein